MSETLSIHHDTPMINDSPESKRFRLDVRIVDPEGNIEHEIFSSCTLISTDVDTRVRFDKKDTYIRKLIGTTLDFFNYDTRQFNFDWNGNIRSLRNTQKPSNRRMIYIDILHDYNDEFTVLPPGEWDYRFCKQYRVGDNVVYHILIRDLVADNPISIIEPKWFVDNFFI